MRINVAFSKRVIYSTNGAARGLVPLAQTVLHGGADAFSTNGAAWGVRCL